MKTLYISDLDGTLLNNSGHISENSLAILNGLSEKGLLFSIATARSIMTARDLLGALRLNAPIVLMNGVFLFDLKANKAVRYHEIDEKSLDAVLSVFSAHNKTPLLFLFGDDGLLSIFYTELRLKVQQDFYAQREKSFAGRFRRVERLFVPERQHAVYVNLVDLYEELAPVADALKAIPGVAFSFYSDTYSPYWFLEVYAASASKANGALEVKKMTGADRFAAFGDNLNDLSLFACADETYAVANAVDEVKRCATAVIQSNEEDGVAAFLLQKFSEKSIDNEG